MFRKSLFFVALSFSLPLLASSNEAWQEADRDLKVACLKISSLKDASPIGNIIRFDDEVGYSALLLKGEYPKKIISNTNDKELCLYQHRNKKAYISNIDIINYP